MMRGKLIVGLAAIGFLLALGTAYYWSLKQSPLPPAFTPASNPFEDGIYSEGIVESLQSSGSNVHIYPEVSGTISRIFVEEGQDVPAGAPLFTLENSIQNANTEYAKAQINATRVALKIAQSAYQKQKIAADIDPRAVSQEALDRARISVELAAANVEVSQKQYEIAVNLLSKYRINTIAAGKIISINTALGSYVSPQGVYDGYTKQNQPVMVLGASGDMMAVRCYVDEILLQRLPAPEQITAYLFIRGSSVRIPLSVVRFQPYISPKTQLSNQRTERVDVRVLPIIFSFKKPVEINIFPGQLVDVYIGKSPS